MIMTKRTRSVRLLSVFLVLTLVLGSGAYAFADDSRFEEREHGTTPVADMKYVHPVNQEQFDALEEELLALCAAGGNPESALDTFDKMYEIYENWYVMNYIAMIRSHMDATDKYYQAELEYTDNLLSRYAERLRAAAAAIVDSPYNDYAREYWGPEYYDKIVSFYETSDEELALYEKEMALISKYNEASVVETTIEYKGEELTDDQLFDLYLEEELSYEEYSELSLEIARTRNALLGGIFVELLAVREELGKYAESAGYENFLDFQYKNIFCREYSIDYAVSLCQNVKEVFAPLINKADMEVFDLGMYDYLYTEIPFEDTLSNVGAYVGKIAPELQESFQYMMEYEQYDFSAAPNKVSMSYSAEIPGGVPFMYHIPADNYYDMSVIIHELGHYNQMYWVPSEKYWPELLSYDVGEVHSQGLELLFAEYYDEIYPEFGDKPSISALYNMCSSIPQTAFGGEFEAYVYTHPGLTLEEINRAAAEIFQSYGFELTDPESMNSWVDIPHFFLYPGYYISYTTSAITALEIWALSLEDREEAVDTYLDTVAMANDRYYEMLDACGLTVPDAALLKELRASLESALHILVDTYGHWAEESIDLLVSLDMVEGVKIGDYYYYQPERSISRAEFVKLLYGIAEGENAENYKAQAPSFSDVAADAWYKDHVMWAVQNGVCAGTGDSTFSPDASLTKQDMAVMIMNLSDAYGFGLEELQGNAEAPDFTDKAAIAGYAVEAVEILQDAGVLTGNPDGSFQPKSTATRAQTAKVLAGLFGE